MALWSNSQGGRSQESEFWPSCQYSYVNYFGNVVSQRCFTCRGSHSH